MQCRRGCAFLLNGKVCQLINPHCCWQDVSFDKVTGQPMNHTNEHKPQPDHGLGIFVAVASTKKATQIKESLLSVLFLPAGVRLFGGILPFAGSPLNFIKCSRSARPDSFYIEDVWVFNKLTDPR